MANEYKQILGRYYCYTSGGSKIVDSTYPLYTHNAQNPTTVKRKRPPGRVLGNGTARFGNTLTISNSHMAPFTYNGTVNLYTVHQVTGQQPTPKKFDPTGELSKSFAVELRNKLRSDFRGEHINLANMMGEYAQTASLFASNAERIAEAWKRITTVTSARKKALGLLIREEKEWEKSHGIKWKKDFDKRRKRIDKEAANAHLEITYGVIPLVSDLNSAMKELRKGPNAAFQTIRTRASRNSLIYGEETYPASDRFTGLPKGTNATITKYVQKYRTYVAEAGISNGNLLACLGNYGITNPVATAWELIPFSFVVDWHCNAGEVLASLDSLVYFTGATYQATTKTIEQSSQACYGGVGTVLYRSYDREAPSALSLLAEFRYKPSISKQHILNGLALLRQLT